MHLPNFKPLLLLLSLLPSAVLTAQENAVNTRFRVIAWKNGDPKEVAYLDGGQPVRITGINHTLRSPFFKYSGTGALPLYDPAQVTADGELPEPIAVAKLTPSVKRPLILLVPAEEPGAKPPFRAVVFEEDPAKFPFGSFMFQNFSPQNVAADMGGETFVVKPGSDGRVIKTPAEAHHLRLALEDRSNEDWRKIYDNFFPNYQNRRTVFFIFQTTENGTPRIQLRSLIESEAAWNAALDPERENKPGTENP